VKSAASDRAASIFLALSHVPPDERAHLLAKQCGGDEALRSEVERLLGGLDVSDSFLDSSLPSAVLGDIPRPDPVGEIVSDFTLIRPIGSGGTGVVYLAHQRHPPRIVALKVLRREFVASSIQRRFEIEAELLGQLHHPGIAQIYAAHPGDGTTPPYIAMEFVNGPALTEFADTQRLSVRDRVDLMARACDAVQHAHQRGIIHRDLKPANILVNAEGQPKVLDFGVARTAGAQVLLTTVETETGQLLGTVAYMSPEQIEASPDAIDTRTDIHALGVILFRVLTGRLPFGHDDPPLPELARRIMRDDAPRLSAIDPALRGDLEVIVARALAKEKDRRYASAAGLAADLRRYLDGQPISAASDSTWYVLRRRIERYRLALALSAAVGVALAALAFYASVQRARVDRVNVEVQTQLTTSTLERARLLSVTGNLPIAEELAWRELFRNPDLRLAQWTLWDIYSREPSLWTRLPHEAGTLTVRFSPDGRMVLTAGQVDGLLRLIDVESGQVARTFSATPNVGTRRAFFTPDGSSIVAGGKDGTLRVWDVKTGALRREIPHLVPSLEDFAIAGGGAHAVTVASGGLLQVWSLATGQLEADLSTLAPKVLVAAADPSGTLLLAGGADGVVTAVDIARRTRVWQARAHQSEAISVAIGPNARTVASGGTDTLVHVRDGATGELLRTIATENGSARNLAFDRSGTTIAVAGQWRTKVWDLSDASSRPRDFGRAEGTTDLDLHPEMRFLVTCRGQDYVRLWDVTADARTDYWSAHGGSVTGLAVGADGHSLFSGAVDGQMSMWRPGQETRALLLRSGDRVGVLAISDDKRWIVSAGYPGTAAVWDARDGRRVAALSDAGSSRAATFADSDRKIFIGELDGTVRVWDWSDGGARNPRRIESPSIPNEVLAMTSHGSRLFVAHRETLVIIREAASGREIGRLRPSASPFSLAVTADGRLLAAGTWPGLVDLWDLDTARKLLALKGPTALVTALDFRADGGLLALSSRDGSTRFWDVAAGQWLATVASRKPGAERLRFFPDGGRLAIGYQDGEVEIRDLQYFFRYAAGNAEYQLRQLNAAGESFPRANEALAWSRRFLSASPQPLH
jgi:serine/threonine protein kinase/WD40 repeat protein